MRKGSIVPPCSLPSDPPESEVPPPRLAQTLTGPKAEDFVSARLGIVTPIEADPARSWTRLASVRAKT